MAINRHPLQVVRAAIHLQEVTFTLLIALQDMPANIVAMYHHLPQVARAHIAPTKSICILLRREITLASTAAIGHHPQAAVLAVKVAMGNMSTFNLPSFHKNLGDLYFDAFKLTEAIAEYKTAISLDPRDMVVYRSMGFAYYMSGICDRPGGYEGAASAFEQALELSPSDAEALYGLGISYESLGDTDKAFDVYFKLKALDEVWANRLLDDLLKNYSREEA